MKNNTKKNKFARPKKIERQTPPKRPHRALAVRILPSCQSRWPALEYFAWNERNRTSGRAPGAALDWETYPRKIKSAKRNKKKIGAELLGLVRYLVACE